VHDKPPLPEDTENRPCVNVHLSTRLDWRLEIRQPQFFAGQVEVERDWPTGYSKMTVVKEPPPLAEKSSQ
jgi:hypothetical protein